MFNEILKNTDLSIKELKPYVFFTDETYTRNLVYQEKNYELLIEGKIEIHNFDTVNTSFPNFLSLIKSVGGKIEIK